MKKWEDDFKKIAGPVWTRLATDRNTWKSLEEAFVEKQTIPHKHPVADDSNASFRAALPRQGVSPVCVERVFKVSTAVVALGGLFLSAVRKPALGYGSLFLSLFILRPAFYEAQYISLLSLSVSFTISALAPPHTICTWKQGLSSLDSKVTIQPERMPPRTKLSENILLF
ncbi:hypothetical protein EVAR_93647_1 [Eumeta japonica]|uniref:Uncharacterized protein n=1 Tax=Eumeta variegata TaxID=151549 RepID=A0A4C1TQM9_EUMVA|nr:hypothetical protein EVAR_93647_1 [Eumeta japonica]